MVILGNFGDGQESSKEQKRIRRILGVVERFHYTHIRNVKIYKYESSST